MSKLTAEFLLLNVKKGDMMKLHAILIARFLAPVLIFISQSTFCVTNTWAVQNFIPGVNFGSGNPLLTLDGSGNAYVVGQPPSGNLFAIRFSRATQSWLSIKTFTPSIDRSLAVDSAGNAIIAWVEFDGVSTSQVKATYYNINLPWNEWVPTIKLIDSISDGFNVVCQVAISDNGTAIIGWSHVSSNSFAKIYEATRFDGTTATWDTWNPHDFLKTNFPPGFGQDLIAPAIAMSSQGNAIFTLYPPSVDPQNLFAVYYDGSTDWNSWDPSVLLKQISVNPATKDSLVMNAQGSAAFCWIEENSPNPSNAIATFFDISQTWAMWSPFLQTIDTSSIIYDMSVAINDDNNIIFSLNEINSTGEIKATRFNGFNWNSWTHPLITLATGFFYSIEQTAALDNIGNGCVICQTQKGADVKIQASLYDIQNDEWKSLADIFVPINFQFIELIGRPAMNIWKQAPINTSPNVMAIWQDVTNVGLFTQTPIPPDQPLLKVQPGENLAVEADADSNGNMHIGVNGEASAFVLTHRAGDPGDVWSLRQASASTHIVDQLALSVNVNDDIALSYINDQDNQGQVWLVVNEDAPELISSPNDNAHDTDVGISDIGQIAEVHVTTTISLKVKNGIDDLPYNDSYSQIVKNNLATGEISGSTFDPVTGQRTSKTFSLLPSQDPHLGVSSLGNIYITWKACTGDNCTIQAVYGTYDSTSNSWIWNNTLDISITGSVDQPRVAVDSLDVNTIFAWREWDGSNWRINAAWFDGYTDWNAWTHTTTFLSPAGFDADNLSMDMDYSGNALVTWDLNTGTDSRIQSAYFDSLNKVWALPGVTRSIPQFISPAGARFSNVALASEGKGMVVYNVDQQTYYNFWNFDTKTFGPATNTNFPSGVLARPLAVANWNGSFRACANTIASVLKQNNNEKIWVTLPGIQVIQKPAKPIIGRSIQKLHRFPLHGDLVNVIRWQAGDNTAVKYEIYADINKNQLLAVIPANCPLVYYQHCVQPGVATTYYLFAVDAAGRYSDPVQVTIP